MSTAIKVENLSKAYQLGTIGTGTLSRDLERWIARMRGKEDPFLTIGEANDRSVKGTSDVVLSLNNVSFDIEQGDAVGIIGRNGAGKSTLLKLLSRVTSPTTGSIKVKGRIASLLEVGTGFHPELTGRENIFLNGAILGMRKKEIARKFDQIVDFAGVERYIDTPVKRYSSGMYVRLAFAVAAHLESEILIVDEVLAVGDAEFQKKCIGKMGDVSKGEGRTVLFVSHNMASINALCNKALVMQNGKMVFDGGISDGMDYYLKSNTKNSSAQYSNDKPKETDIISIKILNTEGNVAISHNYSDEITIEFKLQVEANMKGLVLGFRIKDQKERNIFTSQFDLDRLPLKAGIQSLKVKIPGGILVPNQYYPIVAIHIPKQKVFTHIENSVNFEIEELGTKFSDYADSDYGCVFVNCDWIV